MAKKDEKKQGLKDLGIVKEVYCSGVSVTTTGEKVFIANVSKGDRIIEENGKQKVAPKAAPKPPESKEGKSAAKNQNLAVGQNANQDFLDVEANNQSGNTESLNLDGDGSEKGGE